MCNSKDAYNYVTTYYMSQVAKTNLSHNRLQKPVKDGKGIRNDVEIRVIWVDLYRVMGYVYCWLLEGLNTYRVKIVLSER